MFSSQNSQVSSAANYIEDVFNSWPYNGTGSSLTITNNIDLSTKGGMVWLKRRGVANNQLYDTTRGVTKLLVSNTTSGQATIAQGLTAFNTTGFTLGTDATANTSGNTYASWTFSKQPKFFDIATYTGDSTDGHVINHSLGSSPACIFIKRSDGNGSWYVYHTSISTQYLTLNSTGSVNSTTIVTAVSSNTFTLPSSSLVNNAGETYVAYIFASNAGGFGLTGTDNAIACGSYTGNTTTFPTVTVGFEPQWLLIKRTDAADDWFIMDNMRGLANNTSGGDYSLFPNSSSGEDANATLIGPTSTGFILEASTANVNANGGNYIYIAIRRGPMKVPTSGTSVYGANAWTGGETTFNTFPPDLGTRFTRSTDYGGWKLWGDRLRGEAYLNSIDTSNEQPDNVITFNGAGGGGVVTFGATAPLVSHFMRRSPSFLDVVCYTGNGTAGATQTHNLGAVPEMMIVKDRDYSGGRPWTVYHSALGATKFTYMNQTSTPTTSSAAWNDTTPTSSVFTLGSNSIVNFSGTKYLAYLFATCAGVSKVGSYTGDGTDNDTKTVNCGFTGGARFVIIKRTDATGDWMCFDTARGFTSGFYNAMLKLNSSAAEISITAIGPRATGFYLSQDGTYNLNVNGGTYIFLAIA
jgi:hypothetical protein